jgi:hypothetical protein
MLPSVIGGHVGKWESDESVVDALREAAWTL